MFICNVVQDNKVNFIMIISSMSSLYLQLHKCLIFSKTSLLPQITHNQIYTENVETRKKVSLVGKVEQKGYFRYWKQFWE